MKPLNQFIKEVETSYPIARRLAVDAYTLLTSPGYSDQIEGLDLLWEARQINHCAVDALDEEIEKQQDKWVDTFQYPDPMPEQYGQVKASIKEKMISH